MERAEWLKQIRHKVEALYDHFSPKYWVTFGFYPNETHLEYLKKFLEQMNPNSTLLSAACGAGRYDGILLEASHSVIGIDQSAGMLKRAKAAGLPVVFGEVVDEAAYKQALNQPGISGEQSDIAAYHYYPSLEQVRAWIEEADLTIEDEGTGNGYEHFIVSKRYRP